MTLVSALERGQELIAADLRSLDDGGLDRTVMTNWGETWRVWRRIFWTMAHHDLWHGGEIGALRDLFRARYGS